MLHSLPVSTSGNRYVLMVIDYFRKGAEEFPIPNQGNKNGRIGLYKLLNVSLWSSYIYGLIMTWIKKQTYSINLRPVWGKKKNTNNTANITIEYLRKVVCSHYKDLDEHISGFLSAAKIVFGTNLILPGDLKFGTKHETFRKAFTTIKKIFTKFVSSWVAKEVVSNYKLTGIFFTKLSVELTTLYIKRKNKTAQVPK